MSGLDRTTGDVIDGIDLLRQQIEDVLSTPVGTRVLRRDYGSELPRLVGAPLNGETVVDVYAATAEAIDRFVGEFALARVTITAADPGRFMFEIAGAHPALGGAPITVEVTA
jgi:phage baseplate assembly protein W